MPNVRFVKKSTFPASTSLESSDYFDFVRNGQNLRISFSDLLASLGVTGDLESVGSPSAIPILSKNGSINNIRSILGGAGILASLDPTNSVKISHNFNIDKSGAALIINETADQPTIRSIIGGTGITVAATGNLIQVSTSESPGSTKTVYVYTESDLPTPSGGIITLADNTEYVFLTDLTTVNQFILGDNTVIAGSDASLITLTYTGTGTMFTGTDKNCKFKDISLVCNSGTLFDISSSNKTHRFQYLRGNIQCRDFGTLSGLELAGLYYLSINDITLSGLKFSGNIEVGVISNCIFKVSTGTTNAIDLQSAVFDSITINNILFDVNSSGYCISGLANSGNITPGKLGSIYNCVQNGTAQFLNNISPFDDLWECVLNPGILNSADICLSINTGATIAISAASTPVIINTTWSDKLLYRFTSSNGRFTYTGKGSLVYITASISADIVTGTDNVSFFLYKNGVQISDTKTTREFIAGNIGNISLLWADEAQTNDYYELWVQNDDTSVDVNIYNATMRIIS